MEFIDEYFGKEKISSVLFVASGVIGIAFSIYCWFVRRNRFLSGMAWPIMLFSIVQLGVGVAIFIRTAEDIERVKNMKVLEPERLLTEEMPRIEKVINNFEVYRYLELAMIVIGLLMITTKKDSRLRGIGLGLVVEGSILLLADGVAAERAILYFENLQNTVSPLRERT